MDNVPLQERRRGVGAKEREVIRRVMASDGGEVGWSWKIE